MIAPDATGGLGARVDAELDALVSGGTLQWMLFAALTVVVIVLVLRGIDLTGRVMRTLVGDRERRVDRVVGWLKLATIVLGTIVALRPMFVRAPVVATTVCIAVGWILARVATGPMRDLLAGLTLVGPRVLSEGDVLEFNDERGTVDSIGLFRTRLVLEDGSRRWIPNRLLAGESLTLATTSGAALVHVDVELPKPTTPEVLEQIRQVLVASVFRVPHGLVAVTREGEYTVKIELETWARGRTDEIGRRLARRLRSDLAPKGATR